MKKPFSIGKITAEPGEVAKGFIPTLGLEMPDGTGNFWPIPVMIINGTDDGPVSRLTERYMQTSRSARSPS